jgi:hypothetical protein
MRTSQARNIVPRNARVIGLQETPFGTIVSTMLCPPSGVLLPPGHYTPIISDACMSMRVILLLRQCSSRART